MASNVTVAFLADVTDLRTKSALAKAELSDVNSSIREQAAAFQELSDEQKGPALAALQALTVEQKELQESIRKTTAEIRKNAEESEKHAGVLGGLHERVKLTGESFEHLSASIGVWTGAASAIGEFALLGLGLEKITEEISKFTENAEAMQKLAAATGLTTAQLYGLQLVATDTATPFETVEGDLTKLVRAMENAAQSADSGPARAFAAMGVAVTDSSGKLRPMGAVLDEVAAKLASYKDGTGKAALELQLFGRNATDLNTFLNELGRDGLEAASDKSKFLGDTISGPVTKAATDFQDHVHLLSEEWVGFTNTINSLVLPALNSVMRAMAPSLDEQIEKVKGQIAEAGKVMNPETWGWMRFVPGMQLGTAMFANPMRDSKILQKQLEDLLAQKAKLEADTHTRDNVTGGAKPHGTVDAPAFSDKSGDELKAWKDELLQKQVVEGQFHAMSAAQEASFWQSKIALTKAGSDAQREVLQEFESASRRAQSETSRAGTKAIRDEWETYSASIREKISADEGFVSKQIELASEWLAKAKAMYGEDSKQYSDALKEQNTLKRAQAEQNLAIEKEMAEAQANLAKIGEGSNKDEFKPSVGLAFDSSAMNAQVAAQVAQLKSIFDLQLGELQKQEQDKISLGDMVAAAGDYKDATADLEAYVAKVAQLNQQAANAVQESWAKIGTPIEGAFSKIAGAAIGGGRQSGLAMERAAIGVVQSWAKSGIEMLAHWVAVQLGMTAATAAGSAARVVAATPEEAATITQLAAMLGKHVSVEVAKTGATMTGVAVRTNAEVAGAATSKAAASAAGSSTVMSAAAKAAAGAYSSVAQIPYVGWILAPAAATVAFAAVAAYETVASAEGGWGQVPYDNYPTNLHKDEMVLPRNIADSVREMADSRAAPPEARASNNAGGGSTVNMGGNTHSAAFSQTNHFYGTDQEKSGDMAEKSAAMVHSNLQHWYGNTGTPTLPGRQVRK